MTHSLLVLRKFMEPNNRDTAKNMAQHLSSETQPNERCVSMSNGQMGYDGFLE